MLKIKLLNEIKQHASQGIPAGWFIRTTTYVSGFVKRDLLLCTPATEVRVPISKDFNLTTPKLAHDIPPHESIKEMELRVVDTLLNFQVTSFTTSKAEKRTTLPYIKMLAERAEDPDYLFCMGLDTPPGYQIVNIETEACVVRDYIDKNRLFAALVLTLKNSQPNTTVTVTMSSKTENITVVSVYTLDKHSDIISKVDTEYTGDARTEFITFPNRLIKKRGAGAAKKQNSTETQAAPQPKAQEQQKKITKNKFNKNKKN